MIFSFKHTKLACYSSYMSSAVAINFPPILFIFFHKQFDLSLVDLGALISLNFGVQMITDIIGASLIDKKITYRQAAVTANSLVSAGLLLLGILPQIMGAKFLSLIIATIVYSVGCGLLEVIISPIVEAVPEDGKASNMALLHSFYCWGQLVAILFTTILLFILGNSNWWIISILWSIVPVFAGLLFSKVPLNTLPKEDKKSSVSLFKNKTFIIFLLLMTASGAAEIAIAQWASMFVETALGVTKTVGDLLGPCMFALLMGVARVIYAKFSKKLNLSNYIVFCGILCIASYLVMVFVPNKYVALAAVGVVGFSVGIMWPGTLSLASVKFPLGGTAMFAYLAIFGDIGCTTGPALAATVSESTALFGSPLKAGILACVVFPVLVVVLTLTLNKMRSESNA
ncbi:MAG: MFS transporter [Clostridia bacterium]|nr:MFS transporter [Clostridia bacterium]